VKCVPATHFAHGNVVRFDVAMRNAFFFEIACGIQKIRAESMEQINS
jgi:hypothetical protein